MAPADPLDSPREPRFLCDAMLGHLARDLRLLGYDVAYDPRVDDDELLEQARRDGRLLLTKDRELARRAGRDARLVQAVPATEALREVLDALHLRPEPTAMLTRCTRCGGRLAPVASSEASDAVPRSVLDAHAVLDRCSRCGHHYWEGTHARSIRERLLPLTRTRPAGGPEGGTPP